MTEPETATAAIDRMTAAIPDLVIPRYGYRALDVVAPSLLAALGAPGHHDLLDIGPAARILLLVADGLGWQQLLAYAEHAPTLTSGDATRIDAPIPSTTAAGISTIGVGLPPIRHGMLGYTVGLTDEDQPFNLLTWRIGMHGGGADVRGRIAPEVWQSERTVFERAAAHGIGATTVLQPEFLGSGFTRAALRGGAIVRAAGLADTLAAGRAALRDPGLVYAYHPDIDTAGHAHGPGSDPWLSALTTFDAAVGELVADLPADTTLVITSDHGMVEIPDDDMFELADEDDLLADVRLIAGEGRFRQLHVRPGCGEAVVERWRIRLGTWAEVVTRHEAISMGWFGPDPDWRLAARLGDVLVAMHRGSVVHRDVDPFGGRLRGQHGGRTRAEVEVPMIVFRGAAR
jgi:hypothetical protein